MEVIDFAIGEQIADSLHLTEDSAERRGLTSMAATLGFADVDFEKAGIYANIREWASSKDALLSRLRRSPDWHEEILSVVKEVKYSFTRSRYDRLDVRDRLFRTLENKLTVKGGEYADIASLLNHGRNGDLGYSSEIFLGERITNAEEIEFVKNVLKYPRVQSEMKCTRLLQKLIKQWDENFMEDTSLTDAYNTWAEFISETQTSYSLVLSLNPADYLLMSYGHKWTSCHILNPDLAGEGSGYDGQWRAGTLSYMNDKITAIAYVVNSGNPIEKLPFTPKIMRQVILLDPERPRFFQSRLYPGKDGSTQYELFSGTVKSILSEVFEVEKDGWEQKDAPTRNQMNGHHYADYNCYSNSCYYYKHQSVLALSRYDGAFNVGAQPLCIKCGRDSSSHTDTLYCEKCEGNGCESCRNCGCEIDNPDNIHWIDGSAYCDGCVTCCCHCERDVPVNDTSTDCNGNPICQRCVDRHYFECSGCGELFHHDDRYTVEDDDDAQYCSYCYGEHVSGCERCGESFSRCNLNGDSLCVDCAGEVEQEEASAAEEILGESDEAVADVVPEAVPEVDEWSNAWSLANAC